jgi:hypothetical protein
MGVLLREIYEQQLDGHLQSVEEGIQLARGLLRRDAALRGVD